MIKYIKYNGKKILVLEEKHYVIFGRYIENVNGIPTAKYIVMLPMQIGKKKKVIVFGESESSKIMYMLFKRLTSY